MSLINDALRRASQAHREHEARRGAPLVSAKAPSSTAETSSLSPPWASRLLALAASLLLLSLLVGGAWYGWRTWVKPPAIEAVHPKARPARAPVQEAPHPLEQPTATVARAVTSVLPPSPAVTTAVPVARLGATNPVVVRAPVIWPRLKLQGIIYKFAIPML